MKKTFEGVLKNTFKCLSCKKEIEKFENFRELMIPIPPKYHKKSSTIQIQELLKEYFSIEIIEDYQCEHCQKKSKLQKFSKIHKLPEVLIVVFNIFNVVGEDLIAKLQKKIEVPLYDLNLNDFHSVKGLEHKTYNLDSFISHLGSSVDFGHYIR